jgi:hypothetical protein
VSPDNNGTALLQAALDCAGRGWAVLPTWPMRNGRCACGNPECPSPGKHPLGRLVPHGLKNATTDEGTLRGWWQEWPDAGIAIATGAASGIDALDIDGELGEDSVQRFALPDTVVQRTGGGGRHVLFRYREGLRNRVRFAPGLDIRTDGGYIVVAPTLHASGRRYAWAEHPNDKPVADWPDELYVAAEKRRDNGDGRATAPGTVAKGARNDTLFKLACSLRRQGLGFAEILAGLVALNARCSPPLPEAELRSIAQSAGRYDADDEPEPLPVCELEDLLASDLPQPEPVIGDRVLDAGGVALLAGPPGSSKSFAALQLALGLARGDDRWLDFHLNGPGRVLLVSLEGGAQMLKERAARLLAELGGLKEGGASPTSRPTSVASTLRAPSTWPPSRPPSGISRSPCSSSTPSPTRTKGTRPTKSCAGSPRGSAASPSGPDAPSLSFTT